MKWRWVILGIVVVLILLAGAAGSSFYVGFIASGRTDSPLIVLNKLETKFTGTTFFERFATVDQYASIFLNLSSEQVDVPGEGSGGGLTSFGDDVLVLTSDGIIYAVNEAGELKQTSVATPDNGLEGYRRLAQTDKYRDYTHRFDRIRYNDILFVEGPTSNKFLISYTEIFEDDACFGTAIAELEFDASIQSVDQLSAAQGDWEVVFRTQPCLPLKSTFRAIEGHMAGGRLAFAPPSTVYLASGDYHWDGLYAPEAIAQDLSKQYGKVIAIDVQSHEAKIVSSGHRNTQGIVVDGSGNVWVTEHGMRGGDELNLVRQGRDYGWPSETLGVRYNGLPAPGTGAYGRHDQFTAPTFAWVPSVATSNVTVIDGFADAWDGDLLVASLKDKSLFRMRIKEERVVFAERIEIGRRIRYVHQHTDGRIVLWTDDRKLLFLAPLERGAVAAVVDEHIASAGYDGATQKKVRAAVDSCMECHAFEFSGEEAAPNLGSIFGARIASTRYQGYSEGLSGRSGRWTAEELATFIADPQAYAPGTSMPPPGIDDPAIISGLVDVLEAISVAPE